MGKRLEPVARRRRFQIDDIVKQQVPFIQCLVRSGKVHWTASILGGKCGGIGHYLRFCCLANHCGILSPYRSEATNRATCGITGLSTPFLGHNQPSARCVWAAPDRLRAFRGADVESCVRATNPVVPISGPIGLFECIVASFG